MFKPSLICSHIALCAGLLAMPSFLSAQESEMVTLAGFEEQAEAARDKTVPQLTAQRPDDEQAEQSEQAQQSERRSWPKFELPKIVFDETWASVGIGAGLVPSYSGSDDYVVFPLPLIVGRVGGIGIRPNGPGLRLDLLSAPPTLGGAKGPTFNFGPAIRIRNDRVNQIRDNVVEQAEDLDLALEVGIAGGVSFPNVFTANDALSFNVQSSADVLGAHDGFLIEPNIGYSRPFGTGILLQASIGAQFVDDNFADYYYSVTPQQSAATGLSQFTADGGLNSVSSNVILNFDLDGNAINGGLSIYTIAGYSRLVGDGANTPFTAERGDANQFLGGVGLAYTF